MSSYYAKPPAVNDGETAYAKDVNDVNNATDSAFSQVEAELTGIPNIVQLWAEKAQKWAEENEDVAVEPLKYSAKHWAAKSEDQAAASSASATSSASSASTADTRATAAASSATSAASSATSADSSATTATSQATLASKWAEENEDVAVVPGKFSAKHWATKASNVVLTAVKSVTGTGVNNTDPTNPIISITKSTIGLGNVDNTSDANKPVSTATQTALNDKEASLGNPASDGFALFSTAAGARSWAAVSAGPKAIQVFTASGTYTKTSGATVAIVEVVGGGGSGGGSGAGGNYAGGGGAGGYSRKRIDISGVTTVTVTVGSGGAAVSSSSNGNTGGTSSFGAYCSATGGVGGLNYANGGYSTSASGGSGSGGDVNANGGCGGLGNLGGDGGTSFFGGQRRRGGPDGGYGAGGQGASETNGATSGAGVNGIVIVVEF